MNPRNQRMLGTALSLLLAAFVLAALVFAGDAQAADLRLQPCVATPDDEAKIPAQEAGVLVNLAVKQGALVVQDQLLGNIDDRQAVFQRDGAKAGYEGAYERFKSDIEIRYAEASSRVAKAAVDKMVAANNSMRNSVTDLELQKARLEYETALLQIEKAKKDQSISAKDMGSKKAEYDLGELGIKRRAIIAPFNGVVVDVFRHQNEWLSPGADIIHLMKLDVMRVDGHVLQREHDPQEIMDCEVTVEVQLARRTEQFTGRVTFVSPVMEGAGDQMSYLVRAEVINRKEGDQYLLRPYHMPTMIIHLGTGRPARPDVGLRGSRR